MRSAAACTVCVLAAGACSGGEVHFDVEEIRLRPRSTVQVGYTVSGATVTHKATLDRSNALLTATVEPQIDTGTVTITGGTTSGRCTITLKVTNAALSKPTDVLTCHIDTAPTASASNRLQVPEDAGGIVALQFSDAESPSLTCETIGDERIRAAMAADPNPFDFLFFVDLRPIADLNSEIAGGPMSITYQVTDACGTVDIAVPVTITPVNDPPGIAIVAADAPAMDPASGRPVAVCASLAISDPVDGQVSLANSSGSVHLGWRAEVTDGVAGLDLLSLAGDATYRIDGDAISVAATGTVVASWRWLDGRSDRLAVELRPDGTLTHLQEIAGLLRYAYLQGTGEALTRRIAIRAVEPDGPETSVSLSPVATATIAIAAVNRPPTAALAPATVEPGSSVRLDLTVADGDGLDGVVVAVAQPLPGAGTLSPASCSGAQAMAQGFTYTATSDESSSDRITLSVSDGIADPVLVSAAVTIRSRPDRLSILSDPPLRLVRGQSMSWPLRSVPAATAVTLSDYGWGMPTLAPGVAWTDGAIRFDWDAIGDRTWLAWTLTAGCDDADIDPSRRQAVQRVLVRIAEPVPAAGDGVAQ